VWTPPRPELVAELPPDDRAHLCDLSHCGERSNRRHQRVPQGGRNGDRAGRADVVVPITASVSSANSRMALVSSSTNSGTPSVLAGSVRGGSGERLPLVSLETYGTAFAHGELERFSAVHMSVPRPARLRLGAVGQHDQQREGSHPDRSQMALRDWWDSAQCVSSNSIMWVFPGGLAVITNERSRLVLVYLRSHRERPYRLSTGN